MTLHAHIETNAHVTGCLDCGKPYKKVIEAVADYLHQTAEHDKIVRDKALKRKAILDGLQSSFSKFGLRGLSQAAACDGQVYPVNYSNTQPGTHTNILPLFTDQKHH